MKNLVLAFSASLLVLFLVSCEKDEDFKAGKELDETVNRPMFDNSDKVLEVDLEEYDRPFDPTKLKELDELVNRN